MTYRAVINTHSFVDVITNSSTELFVLDSNKSISTVKEILKDLISVYNSDVESGTLDENWGGTSHSPRKAELSDFDEPYIFTKEMYEEVLESDAKYRRRQEEENKKRVAEGKHPWTIYDTSWGYETKENIGKVILSGASSNTIPYEMWDYIRDTFSATNYHLG